MGNPRRYARIVKWLIEPGQTVQKGERLVKFRIYEQGLVHPKKNPSGRFPPNYPSPEFRELPLKQQEEKRQIEEAMKKFDGEWIDDDTDEEAEGLLDGNLQSEITSDRRIITSRLGSNGVEKAKPQIFVLQSLGEGQLVGLLRDPGSKICSFDELAFADPGSYLSCRSYTLPSVPRFRECVYQHKTFMVAPDLTSELVQVMPTGTK